MPSRRGSWYDLSPRTQARWLARYGGRGKREIRERRAAAAYDAGAVIHRREAGHEVVSARPVITALAQRSDGSVGYVDLVGLGKRTRARIARHDALLGQLTEGRITPAAFRRRVEGWVPVAGLPLVATPTAALAAVETRREQGEGLGPYPEGRGS